MKGFLIVCPSMLHFPFKTGRAKKEIVPLFKRTATEVQIFAHLLLSFLFFSFLVIVRWRIWHRYVFLEESVLNFQMLENWKNFLSHADYHITLSLHFNFTIWSLCFSKNTSIYSFLNQIFLIILLKVIALIIRQKTFYY